jgi:hypothetical protein
MKQAFEIQLPFAGFYGGAHDAEVDNAFDQMMQDREGRGITAPDRLYHMALDAVSWGDVYRDYARVYAETFLHIHELTGRFVAMTSPKFYNFETDRVFVEIDRPSLAKIIRGTDPETLARIAADRHTSRSGFISFYSPDWKTWGRVSTWDHNQLETLLLAYLETERGEKWDFWAEMDVMEGARCNGYLDQWIWDNAGPDLARAVNAWDYLQDRQARSAA